MRRELTVTLCGMFVVPLCVATEPPARDAMSRASEKDALAEFVGPPYHEAPDDAFVALLGDRVASRGDRIARAPGSVQRVPTHGFA